MKYRDISRALIVSGLSDGNDAESYSALTLEALKNLQKRLDNYCSTVVHSGAEIPSEVSSAYFRITECLNNYKQKKK